MRNKLRFLNKIILALAILFGLTTIESKENVSKAFDQSYFVDIDEGFAFARSASGKEPREFPGYEYVKTKVETAGSMVMHTHYYKKKSASSNNTNTSSSSESKTASPANSSSETSSSIKLDELAKGNFASIAGSYKAKNGVVYKFTSNGRVEFGGKNYILTTPHRTTSVRYKRDMVTTTLRGEGESGENHGNQFIEFFSDRIEHSFIVDNSIVITEPGMNKISEASSPQAATSEKNDTTSSQKDGEGSQEIKKAENSKSNTSLLENISLYVAIVSFIAIIGLLVYYFRSK